MPNWIKYAGWEESQKEVQRFVCFTAFHEFYVTQKCHKALFTFSI